MVETAGVFWIAHTRQAQSALDVKAFLAESRIHPAWIDIIHAVGSLDLSDLAAIGIQPECIPYQWPESSFSEQRILHSVMRSILLGEVEMILLLTPFAAVVLASHIAVGRHNLFPLAAFGAFSAFTLRNLPILERLKASIEMQTPDAVTPNALLISGVDYKRPVKKGTAYESAAWVTASEPSSALAGCCSVIDALTAAGRKHGLAVDVESTGLVIYTALERM